MATKRKPTAIPESIPGVMRLDKRKPGTKEWSLHWLDIARLKMERLMNGGAAEDDWNGWAAKCIEVKGWEPLGYASWEEMLRVEFQTTEADIRERARKDRTLSIVREARTLGKPMTPKERGKRMHDARYRRTYLDTTRHSSHKSITRSARQLLRDSPDLFEKVERGEMKMTDALVQAGIKLKGTTVNIVPPSFARAIWKHFDAKQRRQIAAWISAPEMPAEIEPRRKK